MTSKELRERFSQIIARDAELDKREQEALLSMYETMLFEAEHRITDTMTVDSLGIGGTIHFLKVTGKIRDDEDLWMLKNEIESIAYKKGA